MQNAYKFKNRVGDPDILLSPDTLLSPTKGGALSRAHGRPTITWLYHLYHLYAIYTIHYTLIQLHLFASIIPLSFMLISLTSRTKPQVSNTCSTIYILLNCLGDLRAGRIHQTVLPRSMKHFAGRPVGNNAGRCRYVTVLHRVAEYVSGRWYGRFYYLRRQRWQVSSPSIKTDCISSVDVDSHMQNIEL